MYRMKIRFESWEPLKMDKKLFIFSGQSCQWTRHRAGKNMGYGPIYDWSCQLIEKSTKNDKDLATKTIAHEEKCPVRCHELTNCGDCLSSSGSEGKAWVKLIFKKEFSPGY